MPDTPEITEEIGGGKGRYAIVLPEGTAEMTFSIASPTLRIVDHTGVPDALRGQGLAQRLYDHLVARAAAEGFKIVPLCPFVNRERAKHPDHAAYFAV
ncbi:MAG: GNAT family N-acetyltransferase [Shimia sp.]